MKQELVMAAEKEDIKRLVLSRAELLLHPTEEGAKPKYFILISNKKDGSSLSVKYKEDGYYYSRLIISIGGDLNRNEEISYASVLIDSLREIGADVMDIEETCWVK